MSTETRDARTMLDLLSELCRAVEQNPLRTALRALTSGNAQLAEDALIEWYAEVRHSIHHLSEELGDGLGPEDVPSAGGGSASPLTSPWPPLSSASARAR